MTTLLELFINLNLDNYIEPTRTGTPRGEQIGFSKTKYAATLYMITNAKQKDIAKRLQISHGLLRKWNSESDFKEMVTQHCTDYAAFVIGQIKTKSQATSIMFKHYLNSSFEKIVKRSVPKQDYEEYKDCDTYSIQLVLSITNAISENIKKIDPFLSFDFLLPLLIIVRPFLGKEQIQKLFDEAGINFDKIIKQMKKAAITDMKSMLAKKGFTEQDRKQVYVMLSKLEELE